MSETGSRPTDDPHEHDVELFQITTAEADKIFHHMPEEDQIPSIRPMFLDLCAQSTQSKILHFKVVDANGILVDSVMEGQIPGTDLFDWQSPPPFGGLFLSGNTSRRHWDALIQLAKSQGKVADFHRFHPLSNVVTKLGLPATLDRPTCYIRLQDCEAPRYEFNASAHRNVKRALAKNVRVIERALDASNFSERYSQAMSRLDARDDLRFKEHYFAGIGQLSTTRLFEVISENSVIGSAIILSGPKVAEYHLGEFSPQASLLRPANLLFFRVCEILRYEGLDVFFLGGGRTRDEQDGLLRFKRTMSANLAPFQVLGTPLTEAYTRLPRKNPSWFLHYRNPEGEAS